MNILLISQMYPAYPGQSQKQVNDSLHRLVRRWTATEKVLVVRAHLAPDFRREDPGIKQGLFSLDAVDILNHYFFKVPRCRIFYFNRLYAKLKKIGFYPDVVIAHIGYSLFFGYKIARHFKIPLISAVHHGDLLRGRRMLSDKIWQNIFDHSQGIACRSNNVYREFVRQHAQLQERCFTAYSGIEKELIEPKDFATAKLGEWKKSKTGQVRIISVCSLVKLKNIDANLHALARLDKKIDWFYTIIGEGEERDSLEKLANSLGIANRILFAGYKPREEAIQEMKRSHIFVMVSAPETFGMAYLEAMATGNIVIGARGYGVDGIIEQGRNGFLCTPRAEEDLRLTLENIITGLTKKRAAPAAQEVPYGTSTGALWRAGGIPLLPEDRKKDCFICTLFRGISKKRAAPAAQEEPGYFKSDPHDEKDCFFGTLFRGINKKELAKILGNSHDTVLQYTEDRASQNYLDNIYKFTGKAGIIH